PAWWPSCRSYSLSASSPCSRCIRPSASGSTVERLKRGPATEAVIHRQARLPVGASRAQQLEPPAGEPRFPPLAPRPREADLLHDSPGLSVLPGTQARLQGQFHGGDVVFPLPRVEAGHGHGNRGGQRRDGPPLSSLGLQGRDRKSTRLNS